MGIFDKFFGEKKEKEEPFNIGDLKEKRDVDGLIKVLREDPKRGVMSAISPLSRAATSALGEIGDERAVVSLIRVLGWKNIVEKTFHSADRSGFSAFKKLVDEYTFTRIAAAEALAKIGQERGTEYLLQALKDDGFYVRKAATISLANLGDRRAVKALVECLNLMIRKFPHIYIDVIEALGKFKSSEAVNPLIRVLTEPGSASARRAAAEALGKIGDKRAVEPLIMALMEKPIGEKAAKALRDLGVEEDIIVRGSEFAAKRDNPFLRLSGGELRLAYRLAKEALESVDRSKK